MEVAPFPKREQRFQAFCCLGATITIISFLYTCNGASIINDLVVLCQSLFDTQNIPVAYAYHGKEVMIELSSAHFTPLTGTNSGNQVNIFLNYETIDPSFINQRINSVMKVYWPNQTQFKYSSIPEGFVINETGSYRHATTIRNSEMTNPIVVIQFADLNKTMPLSNPLQTRIALDKPYSPLK